MPLIKVIISSNRPNRFGIQPATWLMELAKEHPEATYELVDLAEVNLPFLNEPQAPLYSYNNYAHEHSKKWSKTIDEADGFIIVTAEYNHGIPAPLKNALDTAAREWYYKPAAVISYGSDAGGARAVEQIRSVFTQLRVHNLHDSVIMVNYWAQLDEKGQLVPTDQQTQDAHRVLKSTAFWAEKMQPIRAELKEQNAAKKL